MSYPTTPATFPTHVTGEVVRAAHVNGYANEIEFVENAWLNAFGQTGAAFRLRTLNSLEWGDGNAAGGGSFLGGINAGSGVIGLHCETGTTVNTYKTRGIPGVVIAANSGNTGLYLASIPLAAADNQAPNIIMTTSPVGAISFAGCPVCRLRNATTQSVATGGPVALTFDTEDADVLGMHTAGGSGITVPASGWYLITGFARFAPSNTVGHRGLFQAINGVPATLSQVKTAGATLATSLSLIALQQCVGGDVLTLMAEQTSGGAILVGNTLREEQSQFSVVKIA